MTATHAVQAVALSAALLLSVSGLAKLRAPGPAAAMLAGLWQAARPGAVRRSVLDALVRGVAVLEVGAGAAAIAIGSGWAYTAVGAMYSAFAVVVAVAMRRGASASCGCFGSADAPLGRAHLVVDVAAATVAFAAASTSPPPLGALSGLSPGVAAVAVGQTLVLTWLVYLSITALPALAAARRR
jgi:hypothetical protein